jgi:hypothetical protein
MDWRSSVQNVLPIFIGIGLGVCLLDLMILFLYRVIGVDKASAVYIALIIVVALSSLMMQRYVNSTPRNSE